MKISIRRLLSYFGGVLIILLILFSFVYVLSPWLVKWQVNNWFEGQGLVSSIEDIEINVTDGEFIIRKLDVRDTSGDQRLHIGHALLRIGMRDLFDRKLSVEKIDVGNVFIDVEQKSPGMFAVAGINIPAGTTSLKDSDSQSGNQEAEKGDATGVGDGEAWRLLVHEISFNDFRLCAHVDSNVNYRAFYDCLMFDYFGWLGLANLPLYSNTDKALKELDVVFNSILSGFTIRDEQLQRTIMHFSSLQLEEASLRGVNTIGVKRIILDQYRALQKSTIADSVQPDFLLSSEQLLISDVLLKDTSVLDIHLLKINGIKAKVLIAEDGDLEVQKVVQEFSPVKDTSVKLKTAEGGAVSGKALIVRLRELTVDGGSSVMVRDESVTPVFDSSLSEIRLSVKDIDMSNVKGESQVEFSMVVGEHGKVETSGKAQLFADKPTVNMNAKVVGVNVGDFDAYSKELVQHKVKSGHLDADFNIRIDGGNLDTEAQVKLHKFYVETLGEEEADQYKEKLGIPLSSALSLLRNRDDSISIKMPVTGDVENPDFSLTDIIRKVSALAIKEAVIHYYTPFGLVKLLTKGFDLATALRFEPVLFEAGEANLDQLDKEQLDKLGTLLNERPGIHLVVCGHATQQDFNLLFPEGAEKLKKIQKENNDVIESSDGVIEAMGQEAGFAIPDLQRKKLEELAVNRGKVIKQYLVNQHVIESNRLILCNPKFDITDQSKMRAEITI